ncbi:hypothetical protein [Croceicoccus mobilis]|uniref:hypothetical protein n=1 Tax=Croceicoccus mobilis TaxID=1703339 RepID=UPI000835A8B1|nr:hypothetical protein [Croceicoccus mobilis]
MELTVSAEYTLAMAALNASLQSIRMMASTGLVSPYDVDVSLEGVARTLEHLPEELTVKIMPIFDKQFAAIKRAAELNWEEE